MRKLIAFAVVAVVFACTAEHKLGFGPGDPWSTVAGSPGGLISNYAGPAVAPAIRSLDGGIQANSYNCAVDGTAASLTFTAAGLDIADSGVFGNACGGVVNLFFDGGEIGTATALAIVNLPFFFADAGQPAAGQGSQANWGFNVDCAHGHNMGGLTEGPVELGTMYYCVVQTGDGGNSGATNQFAIYGGPTPLGTTALTTITHDAGPGLVQLQYNIVGHP